MKIILTRHGETIENREGIVQGHLPGKLTKEGIEQAKKLALRLKHERLDCIYSSDLKRASDTAKEIVKYHKNTPFILTEKLRETNRGSKTGMKISESEKIKVNDEETKEDMAKRGKQIIDEAYSKYPKGTVLFVSHGKIGRILMTVIMNKPVEYAYKIEPQQNTSVSIFEIMEDKRHKIHFLNNIDHLK